MRFEARNLKPYAEPVSPQELVTGGTYFCVQFLDDEMLIPSLEPTVFLGRDLVAGLPGLYFQDAELAGSGIPIDAASAREGAFAIQGDNEINHVFPYERALDVLLACSLRRGGS